MRAEALEFLQECLGEQWKEGTCFGFFCSLGFAFFQAQLQAQKPEK